MAESGKQPGEKKEKNTKVTIAVASFSPQPCLTIYVSELKLAFSLAMAIQFGSGVFWVGFRKFRILHATVNAAKLDSSIAQPRMNELCVFLPFSAHRGCCWSWASSWWGRCEENRSSWLCCSPTDTFPVPSKSPSMDLIFPFSVVFKNTMRMLPRYYQDVWICTRKHIMLYTAT